MNQFTITNRSDAYLAPGALDGIVGKTIPMRTEQGVRPATVVAAEVGDDGYTYTMTLEIRDRIATGTCDVCGHPADQHALGGQWYCTDCGGPCRAPEPETQQPGPE